MISVRMMTDDDVDAWLDATATEIGIRCPECHAPPPDCPICDTSAMDGCRHMRPRLVGVCAGCLMEYQPPDLTREDAPKWLGWWGGGIGSGVAATGRLYYGDTEQEVIAAMTGDRHATQADGFGEGRV